MHSFLLVLLFLLVFPQSAFAYLGPGAGFALVGSGAALALALVSVAVTLLFFPFRILYRILKKKGVPKNAKAKRVIVVGLDGLDCKIFEKLRSEGKLPNLDSLSKEGIFQKLQTTIPALSPVAWSSFQTGVNPGAHNIFDFVARDKATYLPKLSTAETSKIKGKDVISLSRKSKPFWMYLGDKGISSSVLRVPVSYPPERFQGRILSAMNTPDIRGTQGTFSLFATETFKDSSLTSGELSRFKGVGGGVLLGELIGPVVEGEKLTAKFSLKSTSNGANISFGDQSFDLSLDILSPWIEVEFKSKKNLIAGICKVCLKQNFPEPLLYISPVNIHPEKPILPISHPAFFAKWISKIQGLFGTLGFLEDTWARNERALSDASFLQQAYENHAERERMFFESLKRTKEGLLVCVFDAPDRIQHMFWRFLEANHPAPKENPEVYGNTIYEMYSKMDSLVGKIKKELKSDDALFVISDHGFGSFRRCVDLNRWLLNEGYLVLKNNKKSTTADYLAEVDWSKSKAFALGLTGIYLNRAGREAQGIILDSEVPSLLKEISQKLAALVDPQTKDKFCHEVFLASEVYRGLYANEAPDLIVGYKDGYRVDWGCVTGGIGEEVFTDNLKAWSGDHHIHPKEVPGVFFSNLKFSGDKFSILDMAPTILSLFGQPIPKHFEGKVLGV